MTEEIVNEEEQKRLIESAINDCQSSGNLSEWEDGFIKSIGEQFQKRGTLSDKQRGVLTKIWTQRVKEAE